MNISSIAQLTANASHQLEHGWVQDVTANGFVVRLANGSTLIAQKSFSCSITPEQEDLVMFTRTQDAGAFILAILQRQSQTAAKMEYEHGIDIQTPNKVKIHAAEFDNVAVTTRMLSQNLDIKSQHAQVTTENARIQSHTIESVSERLVQKVKDSFKIIERLEQVSAKDVIHNIKNAFLQRSKQVDISAKQDVKINGDRIHMG